MCWSYGAGLWSCLRSLVNQFYRSSGRQFHRFRECRASEQAAEIHRALTLTGRRVFIWDKCRFWNLPAPQWSLLLRPHLAPCRRAARLSRHAQWAA